MRVLFLFFAMLLHAENKIVVSILYQDSNVVVRASSEDKLPKLQLLRMLSYQDEEGHTQLEPSTNPFPVSRRAKTAEIKFGCPTQAVFAKNVSELLVVAKEDGTVVEMPGEILWSPGCVPRLKKPPIPKTN